MGQFLRDQRLQNLNVDEAALDSLSTVVTSRVAARNAQLAQAAGVNLVQAAQHGQVAQNPVAVAPQVGPTAQAGPGAQGGGGQANLANLLHRITGASYVIRFDDKGYRFTNSTDVKQHYASATEVERVIFVVDSNEHRQSGGLLGTQLELRLDAKDANACYLTVTSDDKQWVDDTFAALMDVLGKLRNLSGLVRTQWTGAAIQLLGVCVGFLFSVWAALIVAPNLSIDNAFAVSLIFALLIYSIVWGYLNAQIVRLIDMAFPNLRFKRKDKEGFRWLIRGVFIGLSVAFGLYVLKQLLTLAASVLSTLLK